MNAANDDNLLARFAALDSSTLSDVLDGAGYRGQVLSAEMRLIDPKSRMVGRAFCARGEVGQSGAGFSPYELESRVGPGDIAVVATGRFKAGAVCGGMIALQLQNRGAVGFITDGAIRDAVEITGYGLPVVSGNLTPSNSAGRWGIVSVGETVRLPGLDVEWVTVEPGDYILADADGTVVVPQQHILKVIEATKQLIVIERRIVAEIKAGSTREASFARNPRYAHIPKLRQGEQG